MECYTYLIQSEKDKCYYTGISADPFRRLIEHNSGKLKITAKKRPFKLIYYKKHTNYQEARKHEKWLKKKNQNYKNFLGRVAQLAPPMKGGVK